ncbi:DUF4919 domain-containing protein [Oleomonas cavernae]|uniref:DUF4919 domain-containing protein n=1 Tax=Oleomonas cavernae TaxID=2320859 RepID=A0A418WCX4_9PROT|nr:DUF4919 domain-containing protein [Oleomonas cavernae]RJF87875.1 DUF4919 domain-containing protein [Oleomonas cavernae]
MIRLFLLLFVLLLPSAGAQAADAATDRYKAMVAAAQKGEQPVDWQALRFAYSESAEFDLTGLITMGLRQEMFKAFSAGDWNGALAKAAIVIEKAFVNIDAHVISDISYRQLGDEAKAAAHFKIAKGLIDSIRTGDGRTPATAYTVISVDEEYSLMRILGLTAKQQALMHLDGHSYDQIDVQDEDGKQFSIYFLVDRVLEAEAKRLSPPAPQ